MFPHIRKKFSDDHPIPVCAYANDLHRYVLSIVPDITAEQKELITDVFHNIKASHEYYEDKASKAEKVEKVDANTQQLLEKKDQYIEDLQYRYGKIGMKLQICEQENEELKKVIAGKEKELKASRDSCSQLGYKASNLDKKLQQVIVEKDRYSQIAKQLYSMEKKNQELQKVIDGKDEELKNVRDHDNKTTTNFHNLEKKHQEVQKLIAEKDNELKTIKDHDSQTTINLHNLEKEHQEVQKAISEKDNELETLKEKHTRLSQKYEKVKLEMIDLETLSKDELVEKLKRELREAKSESFILNFKMEECKKVAQECLKTNKPLEIELKRLKADYEHLMKSYESPYSEEEVAKIDEKVDNYHEEKRRIIEKCNKKIEMERSLLEEELTKRNEELRQQDKTISEMNEDNERLRDLVGELEITIKNQIAAIGNITKNIDSRRF